MTSVVFSDRAQKLKDEFVEKRGFWVEQYDEFAVLCPDFLEKHIAASAIATKSELISPKLSEFIAIAIDVSTTHLFESGLRLHIKAALKLGATQKELVEVIELVSSLGMQSHLVALPILIDLLEASDPVAREARRELTESEQQLKALYIERFGVWTEGHQQFLLLSPDYFRPYLDVISVPALSSALGRKDKALIMVAANAAVTHLNETGIRASIMAALAMGCSAAEIAQVIRRVSSLGMHSCMVGFPILYSELVAAGKVEP